MSAIAYNVYIIAAGRKEVKGKESFMVVFFISSHWIAPLLVRQILVLGLAEIFP